MCRRHEAQLAAVATAASQGRRFVAEQCVAFGLSELADTAELLTSELVTNAVKHTHAGPTVGVACEHGRLVVDVRDPDPRELARPRDPAAERGKESGGRGLMLVSLMADAWGVRTLGDEGKAVWFMLRPHEPPAYAEGCSCPVSDVG